MKAEDKSSVSRVRIAILGNSNVGKSALTVRYLTRRFIGEYRSDTDLLYTQIISQENGLFEIEIIDVYVKNENDFPIEQIQWADACIIMYSITDRSSFNYAVKSLNELKSLSNPPLAYLIANKSELDHLREVPESEGKALAQKYSIDFYEISVAENTPILYKAFQKLLTDCKSRPILNKQRKFSVSKMIGTLIGSNSNNNNNNNYNKQIPNQGTVVPCHKSDLHKSRISLHKRRQQFTATASL